MTYPILRKFMTTNEKIYKRIYDKKKFLDSKRPLPKAILNNLKKELETELVYNSNAIEGNTLRLNETRLVLEEGVTVKGIPLKYHLETTNHKEAIDYIISVCNSKKPITEEVIIEIHKIILRDIENEFIGRYRPGQVRILGANFIPPNAVKIPKLMKEFSAWLKKNPDRLNEIEFSAQAHYKLVQIHPFIDGNGRVARLLMNLILIKNGYPLVIILNNDRQKYYRALNKANKGDFKDFYRITAQAVERSLDIYLASFGFKKDELKPLSELSGETNISQEYLSLLARQGKLEAFKLGRNWLSTKPAISNYLEKRDRKRKPQQLSV